MNEYIDEVKMNTKTLENIHMKQEMKQERLDAKVKMMDPRGRTPRPLWPSTRMNLSIIVFPKTQLIAFRYLAAF